ncbi:hypothetical protein [Flavivirga aquatica]|nr:hypothetical protein [Flavivirga aquatica]
MTIIDKDNNGMPDGIINLYDSYNAIPGSMAPLSLLTGTWFDPNFNFALDETTGDLYLWDLGNSSEAITNHQFHFLNSASGCPDHIVITLNVIVGPFSGVAVPATGGNNVNVQICNAGSDPCSVSTNFDLFQTFLSTPTAHKNGIWSYEGSSPNFVDIEDNKFLQVIIPY